MIGQENVEKKIETKGNKLDEAPGIKSLPETGPGPGQWSITMTLWSTTAVCSCGAPPVELGFLPVFSSTLCVFLRPPYVTQEPSEEDQPSLPHLPSGLESNHY